ncbi:MAG: helix-turn-helix domain-containing protein [Bacteroidaceae bacterium]|nr:helix-turn-helix domain-containing protein [Bacteroidaceae bacterium]
MSTQNGGMGMEFSEKLREHRLQKGVSQAKLAADIHISRSAVAKWENGLGLPNDESLKILADYFDISIGELMPDKANAETLVSKNKTIDQQKKVIIGFVIGCSIGLFILGYVFIEPLRDSVEQLAIGILLTILGIFNMKGNIASIHWYNRRKVTKENQKPYCLCMGLGTLIIGVGMITSGIIQVFAGVEVGAIFIAISVVIGLVLMLYAQFKYNRGLF